MLDASLLLTNQAFATMTLQMKLNGAGTSRLAPIGSEFMQEFMIR